MEILFFILGFIIFQPYSLCVNETKIEVLTNDLVMIEKTENVTEKKPILRYGFQRTSECLDFDKAFICIHKCQILKYDVAYADKHCHCTCYVKKDKAKYNTDRPGKYQNWKLGVPSTKIPIWAQKSTDTIEDEDVIEEDHLEDFHGNETESILSHTSDDENTSKTNIGHLNEHIDINTTELVVDSTDVNVTTVVSTDAAVTTTT